MLPAFFMSGIMLNVLVKSLTWELGNVSSNPASAGASNSEKPSSWPYVFKLSTFLHTNKILGDVIINL